jgi:hypothetical protein
MYKFVKKSFPFMAVMMLLSGCVEVRDDDLDDDDTELIEEEEQED